MEIKIWTGPEYGEGRGIYIAARKAPERYERIGWAYPHDQGWEFHLAAADTLACGRLESLAYDGGVWPSVECLLRDIADAF